MKNAIEYFHVKTSSVNHTEETKKTLEALRAAGGNYIDDHSDKPRCTNKYVVFSRLEKDGVTLREQWVCWAGDSEYFSLNPMEIDEDGQIHLRRGSVGGVILVERHGSLQNAVDDFNEKGRMFNPEFIEVVIL